MLNPAVLRLKQQLVETGAEIGRAAGPIHPKMEPYVVTSRDGTYHVNVDATARRLFDATQFLSEITASGGSVLLVGSKEVARRAIESEALWCDMPFVATRWTPGILTNFRIVVHQIRELEKLEATRALGLFDVLPYSQVHIMNRKLKDLTPRFGGLRGCDRLPSAVVVVDPAHERQAVEEARRLRVPLIGLQDPRAYSEAVDYLIPAETDSPPVVELAVHCLSAAILDGQRRSFVIGATRTDQPVMDWLNLIWKTLGDDLRVGMRRQVHGMGYVDGGMREQLQECAHLLSAYRRMQPALGVYMPLRSLRGPDWPERLSMAAEICGTASGPSSDARIREALRLLGTGDLSTEEILAITGSRAPTEVTSREHVGPSTSSSTVRVGLEQTKSDHAGPGDAEADAVEPGGTLIAVGRANVEDGEEALVGHEYAAEAGIARQKDLRFIMAALPDDASQSHSYDIFFSDEEAVTLLSDWKQRLTYDPNGPDLQLVEFRFQVTRPGRACFHVDFYRDRHWLTRLTFELTGLESEAAASTEAVAAAR